MQKEEEERRDECLNTSMRISSDLPNLNHLLLLLRLWYNAVGQQTYAVVVQ